MNDIELLESALTEELPYRKTIGEDAFSFGVEIEMECVDVKNLQRFLGYRIHSWQQKEDLSLLAFNSFELSSPIFKNTHHTWNRLRKLSKALKLFNPSFKHASFQVSLDMVSDENLIRLFKFYALYEKVIYCFSKGNDFRLRECIKKFASPIGFSLQNELDYEETIYALKFFQNRKKYGLNINRIDEGIYKSNKVIEFRTPNGTVDAWLWQNYINTFYHMINYVSSSQYDIEKMNYSFKNEKFHNEVCGTLDIEKCLEFVDLIFPNDIDKLYFIKQYLQSNESNARKYIKERHIMK